MTFSSNVSFLSHLYTNRSIANASSIIKTLPLDILGKIAFFFDKCKDAVYLGSAHPRFYCLLSYAPLWDRFFQKDFPDSYAKLQPSLEKSPALYKQLMNIDYNMKAGKSDLKVLCWPNEKIDQMLVHEGMLIIGSFDRTKSKSFDRGTNSNIKILDLKTKKTLLMLNSAHSGRIEKILVCDDKLISYSLDKTIKIWDLKTGKQLDQKVVGQTIRCMAACNGKLVAGLDDNTILVWNLDKPQEEVKVLAGHQNWMNCAILCGGQLISGSSYVDRTIKIWDLETAKELHELDGHRLSITCMTVCDGELISGSSDNTIKIWDLKAAKELCTLHGHQESITRILVHRGMLISGSDDGVIKIWNLKTRQELRTLNRYQNAQEEDMIEYMTAYDDKLISSSWHGEIKIWDLKTGKELLMVTPRKPDSSRPICNAVHDGQIVSSTNDEIKIWDFNIPYESFPLLRELGIVTKEEYSVILKCGPDDLAQRGIRSSDDLQALFNSPNLQRLEFIPEEFTNDRLQGQDRAFKKQQIVSDFLDQLLTAAQQMSETMQRSVVRDESGKVYEAPNPWIAYQEEVRRYQASLKGAGLTQKEFLNKFGSDYAKIVGEVNALIDIFRKLERGTKILRLRAYLNQ